MTKLDLRIGISMPQNAYASLPQEPNQRYSPAAQSKVQLIPYRDHIKNSIEQTISQTFPGALIDEHLDPNYPVEEHLEITLLSGTLQTRDYFRQSVEEGRPIDTLVFSYIQRGNRGGLLLAGDINAMKREQYPNAKKEELIVLPPTLHVVHDRAQRDATRTGVYVMGIQSVYPVGKVIERISDHVFHKFNENQRQQYEIQREILQRVRLDSFRR